MGDAQREQFRKNNTTKFLFYIIQARKKKKKENIKVSKQLNITK